jgi:hypothetical protein
MAVSKGVERGFVRCATRSALMRIYKVYLQKKQRTLLKLVNLRQIG